MELLTLKTMKKLIVTLLLFMCASSLQACQKSNGSGDPVPQPEKPDKKAGDLRIMQYNIHYGVGIDGVYNIYRLISVLKNADADIIILNEADKYYSNRSNNMYMGEYIARQLGMNFVHRSSIIVPAPPAPDREVGNVVLTKSKVEHVETKFFSIGDKWPRVITKSRVELDDGRILYIGMTHFGLTEPGRLVQAREAVDFMADVDDYPVLIAGDLNDYPDSPTIAILKSAYTDAFATVPNANTFPANNPANRIDYIWGNDRITFRDNGRVIETEASDHRPIIVDVSF